MRQTGEKVGRSGRGRSLKGVSFLLKLLLGAPPAAPRPGQHVTPGLPALSRFMGSCAAAAGGAGWWSWWCSTGVRLGYWEGGPASMRSFTGSHRHPLRNPLGQAWCRGHRLAEHVLGLSALASPGLCRRSVAVGFRLLGCWASAVPVLSCKAFLSLTGRLLPQRGGRGLGAPQHEACGVTAGPNHRALTLLLVIIAHLGARVYWTSDPSTAGYELPVTLGGPGSSVACLVCSWGK